MSTQLPSIEKLTKKIRLIDEASEEVPIRTQGIEVKKLTAVPGGLDPHHGSGVKLPFRDIYFLTVFEYIRDPQRNLYLDLFIVGERRPFRVHSRGIAYQEFLGTPDPNAQVNFYSFTLHVLNEVDSICLDPQTINYLKTKQPPSYQTIHDVESHTRKIWHRVITKLKFACPTCAEIYWVDRTAIPEQEPRLKCKKCQKVFPIELPSSAGMASEPRVTETSTADAGVFGSPQETQAMPAHEMPGVKASAPAPPAPQPSTHDETMVSQEGGRPQEGEDNDFSNYLSGIGGSAPAAFAPPAPAGGSAAESPFGSQPPSFGQPATVSTGGFAPAPTAPTPAGPSFAPPPPTVRIPVSAPPAAAKAEPGLAAPPASPEPLSKEDSDISILFKSAGESSTPSRPVAADAPDLAEMEPDEEMADLEDEESGEKKIPAAGRSFRKREAREGFGRWNRVAVLAGAVVLLAFFTLPWVKIGHDSFKAYHLLNANAKQSSDVYQATMIEERRAMDQLSSRTLLFLIGGVGAVVILLALLSAFGLMGSTPSGFLAAAITLAVFLYGFWQWFDGTNLREIVRVTGIGVYVSFFAMFVAILSNLIRSGWIPSSRLE